MKPTGAEVVHLNVQSVSHAVGLVSVGPHTLGQTARGTRQGTSVRPPKRENPSSIGVLNRRPLTLAGTGKLGKSRAA